MQTKEGLSSLPRFGRVLLLDSTHCVTDNGFQLFNVVCVDNNMRGHIVCSFLAERADADTIAAGLRHLTERYVEEYDRDYAPSVVMMDDAFVEARAVTDVWADALPALCLWHIERNLLTRYRSLFQLAAKHTDATYLKIHGLVWNMGYAKPDEEGRASFARDLCEIYTLLGRPALRNRDHAPRAALDRVLRVLGLSTADVIRKADVPVSAGGSKESPGALFWEYLCERLLFNDALQNFKDRAQRLFPVLRRNDVSNMVLLTNNIVESLHRRLKHDSFDLLHSNGQRKNVCEVLGSILDWHQANQRDCLQAVEASQIPDLEAKWLKDPRRDFVVAFTRFAQAEALGDNLVLALERQFWPVIPRASVSTRSKPAVAVAGAGSGAGAGGTAKVTHWKELEFVGRHPRQLRADDVIRAAQELADSDSDASSSSGSDSDSESDDVAQRAADALEAHLLRAGKAARNLLSDVYGRTKVSEFRVRSIKYRDGARVDGDSEHTVTCKRGCVSCDCWHFVGKRLICAHIFHVAKAVLADLAACREMTATRTARLAHDDFSRHLSDMLGVLLVEFVGVDTQWFVRRAPLPVPQ